MKKIRRLQVGGIPVISSIIEKLELRRILSKHLKLHGNTKISTVESLMIVLYSVVTGRRPLYELGDWLSNIHPQCFGFDKIDMGIFNDDRFGRAIEKANGADRATIITEVILIMIDKFGIKTDQLHNDSTTLKSYGKMPGKTKSGMELKRGKSKDHRPDLKQLVYTLTVSADGAVPIHYKAYSGNRTDDTTHIESWDALKKITGRPDFLYVADSKVCTKKQLDHIVGNNGRVVTIMPETWGEVGEFKEEMRKRAKRKKEILRKAIPGTFDEIEYFYSLSGNYQTRREGYKIHWIFSSEKKKRDFKSREQVLAKTENELITLLPKLNKRALKTRQDIEERCKSILNKRNVEKYFSVHIAEVTETERVQVGKGRPGLNTKYKKRTEVIYTLSWTRNKDILKAEKKTDGIFPLLSTDPELSTKEVLDAYKYQPRLEKRFEQLKQVLLGAPLLFKKIERIEGMMLMLFLGLLIQALIEREVRKAMKQEKIKKIFIYPEERPAMAPTTSIILDRFENVSVYHLQENDIVIEKYKDELTKIQKEILRLLDIQPGDYWVNKN
jgi:transposase